MEINLEAVLSSWAKELTKVYNLLSTYLLQAISFKPSNKPQINGVLVCNCWGSNQKAKSFVQTYWGGRGRRRPSRLLPTLKLYQEVLLLMSWKSRASLASGSVTPTANSGTSSCSVTNDGRRLLPCVSPRLEEVASVTSCSYRYTRRCCNTGPNVWIPNRLTVGFARIDPKSYRSERKGGRVPRSECGSTGEDAPEMRSVPARCTQLRFQCSFLWWDLL